MLFVTNFARLWRREIDVIFQCENVKEKSIVSLLGDTF